MKSYQIIGLQMLLFILSYSINAQSFKLLLWTEGVPNSKPTNEVEYAETTDKLRIYHVQNPSIDVYLPSLINATGQAILICPGGGYKRLVYGQEGSDVAKMLNAHGIAGIVLKSRLPDNDSNIDPYKSPLLDAKQAIKLVRQNAEKWNINPDKVGVMGFSAGGHLASTLGTHFDNDSRPNFMALIYPVISMQEEITHMGSRKNLIGEDPSDELIDYYSNELQIKTNMPPTFIVHSSDDKLVPVANSIRFYENLLKKNIAVEMHIYPTGGHGYGLAVGKGYLSSWPERLMDWIESLE